MSAEESKAEQPKAEQPMAEQPSLLLADRITKPDSKSDSGPSNVDAGEASSTAAKDAKPDSWAEDAATPAMPKTLSQPAGEQKPDTDGNFDGATLEQNGSMLQEPEFDVEVKLSDLQADPNNPLYSVKTFEELGGLYELFFYLPFSQSLPFTPKPLFFPTLH
jgi:ATP-dependent RNA helicase DDX19/DBP5